MVRYLACLTILTPDTNDESVTQLNIYLAKVAQLLLVGKTVKLVEKCEEYRTYRYFYNFSPQQADNRQTSICIMK
jgi:hypothetical protein